MDILDVHRPAQRQPGAAARRLLDSAPPVHGLPLWVTEALFEALLAMAAAAGMYLAARTVGRFSRSAPGSRPSSPRSSGSRTRLRLAYIWYHVLYVQVLWAALPWLCLFVLAAERDRRLGKLCLGAFAVGVAASPGLTQAELPQTFLVLAFLCLFVGVVRGRRGAPAVRRRRRLVRERAPVVAAPVAHESRKLLLHGHQEPGHGGRPGLRVALLDGLAPADAGGGAAALSDGERGSHISPGLASRPLVQASSCSPVFRFSVPWELCASGVVLPAGSGSHRSWACWCSAS